MSSITVVSVTGLLDAAAAGLAIELSMNHMPGSQGLLCSPQRPSNLDKRIAHHTIKPLNYNEYSWFILFMLWRVVTSDYALIVQDDGWIINPQNWTDDYLAYDYIGAPIHLAKVTGPNSNDEIWHRGFEWTKLLSVPGQIVTVVQNGGFSLRSMRMMRAICEHNIVIELPPPNNIANSSLSMDWYNDCLNEDVQLSGILRDRLTSHGLTFAPDNLAKRFSIEHADPVLHDGFAYASLFGHHSKFRRLKSIAPLILEYMISNAEIDSIYGEREIHHLFTSLGYIIIYASN